MAISSWDSFTANDWERISNRVGWLTALVAIVMAVVTWVYEKEWKDATKSQAAGEGVWSLIVFAFVSFLEVPLCAIGPCQLAKNFVLETLQLKRPLIVGVIYVLASILCFIFPTPVIGTGIMLLVSALLKFFAQCQVSQDAADSNRLSRPITGANNA